MGDMVIAKAKDGGLAKGESDSKLKAKLRLDVLLVERGMVPSRERAQALIMAGQVLVDEQKVGKSGTKVAGDARASAAEQRVPASERSERGSGLGVFGMTLDLSNGVRDARSLAAECFG